MDETSPARPSRACTEDEHVRLDLEQPLPGARLLAGTALAGFGWVLASARIRAMRIECEGAVLGHAELGFDRPDLAELTRPYPGARPGFRFTCRLPERVLGAVDLALVVETERGQRRFRTPLRLVADATLADPQPDAAESLRIELEDAQRDAQGLLVVRGWAVGRRPLRHVELWLGSHALGFAETGLSREDVGAAHRDYPNAASAGFALRAMLPAGLEAEGELTAVATDASGATAEARRPLAPAERRAAASVPMHAMLEETRVNEQGVLRVRGWAVSLAAIQHVRVFLGETLLGEAQRGLPREDVGLAHPDYPGAAEAGFLLQQAAPEGAVDGLAVRVVVAAFGGIRRELAGTLIVAPQARRAPPEREAIHFHCDAITLSEAGALAIKGWAVCASGVAAIDVAFGEQPLGQARTGEERGDVGNAFPHLPAARKAGFRFEADIGGRVTGEHVVSLTLRGARGESRRVLLPVQAVPVEAVAEAATGTAIRCYLDTPAIKDGRCLEPVRGFLSLHGWAFSRAGVTGIEVFIDGRAYGRAHYGIRREDLHQALGEPQALRAGFATLIPPQALPRGRHEIRLLIRDAAGQEEAIAFAIEAEPALAGEGPWSLRRRLTQAESDLKHAILAAAGCRPAFTVLLPEGGAKAARAATLASLEAQAYAAWRIAPAAAPETPLADLLDGEPDALLLPLAPGDVLGADALLELALGYALEGRAPFLYADERRIDPADHEMRAFFKPDFSPDLLRATNYIGRPWAATREALARAGFTLGGFAREGEYDAVLRLAEAAERVAHVPLVLAERGAATLDRPAVERRALARALARTGTAGTVLPGCLPGTYRTRRRLDDPGLVSIIIPTAGARGLVRTAIETIRAHTARPIEIVVLDNIAPETHEQAALKDWLRGAADRIVEVAEPFNWSRFNNLAARTATGAFLLFLNDDIEVADADWLDAMLEYAAEPGVGAVGPLLLYGDRRVQHAGQFLAGSVGRHAFRFSPVEAPGPFGLALTPRTVISVTGACLLTRRAVFESLGGFDESHAVINNDLDFCLRVRKAGMRAVYTPHARLIHHEMASRAALPDAFDTEQFRARWADLFARGDPYFSRHLAPDADDFAPEQEPLVELHVGHPLIARAGVRRILAIKVDHIGDFVSAFPAFRRLKEVFPQAELTVLAAGASAALAPLEPAIDRVLRFDFFHARSETGRRELTEDDLAGLAATLVPYRFDLALDLRRQPDTRRLLQASGARFLGGFDREAAFPWLDIAMPWEGDIARTYKRAHISEALVGFIDAVGAACDPERRLIAEPPSGSREAAAALPGLAALAAAEGRRLVAIHAGAGAENKQWPAENFAALIDLLAGEAGAFCVVIGGADEAAVADCVLDAVRRRDSVASVVGAVALRDLPTLLAACDLYVGNDSGPKHIAAALGVPTLAIHSGTVDPVEWGPLGAAAVAVRRAMTCSPCYLAYAADCHRALACLRGIRVADVWPRARRLLALRSRAAEAPPRAPAAERSAEGAPSRPRRAKTSAPARGRRLG
jgi:ADP-heptose:LPS heptosyltransferase/GT2 family glycosyltransferase